MRKLFALASAVGLASLAFQGHAQADDEIEVVDTRSQVEIVLVDADFLRPEDVSTTIFGGTDQFIDEMILIELELIEPITSGDLDALKASSDNQTRFMCEEAVLYLANGWYVATATG